MRLWTRLAAVSLSAALLLVECPRPRAQQESLESKRKMISKIVPIYPNLAQKMGISGSVKIEALVAPNGTVKSAGILGGHPVLAQAGVDAVRKCKWEPASRETKEVVVLNFHPD
jgi:TonB family protein